MDWTKIAAETAVEAARELAPELECLPGSYERAHLDWTEYAASTATAALEGAIVTHLEDLDLHDFEYEKRERAVSREVNESFFDPYVRELKKLRPDLRECGDDGDGIDGLRGGKRVPREVKRWLSHPDVTIGDMGALVLRPGSDLYQRVGQATIGGGRTLEEGERYLRTTGDTEAADWLRDLKIRNEKYDLPPHDWRLGPGPVTDEERAFVVERRAQHAAALKGGSAMKGFGAVNLELFDEIAESMAWSMWAMEWSNAWERAVEDGETDERPPWSGGGKIDPHVPETPDEIVDGCKIILREALLRAKIDEEELLAAAEAERYGPNDAEELGSDLGHAWIGTGGGTDALYALKKSIGFDIGHGELHLFLVDGDPETVEINYFGGTGLSAKRIADGGARRMSDEALDAYSRAHPGRVVPGRAQELADKHHEARVKRLRARLKAAWGH